MSQEYNLDRIFRFLLGAGFLVGLFLLLRSLSAVLLPFFIALLLAYLLNPIVVLIQKGVKYRGLAIGLTVILLIGLSVGLWFLLVPALLDEYRLLSNWVSTYASKLTTGEVSLENMEQWILQYVDQEELNAALSTDNISSAAENILPGLWSSIGNVFSWLLGLLGFITILLYLFFILAGYDKISGSWRDYLPPKYKDRILMVIEDLELGMRAYFKQQTKIVICVGILFAIAFKIIDLPMAISLGLFIGLLNYVPYLQLFGFLPATLAAALMSLHTDANFWVTMLWVVVAFSAVQLIQEAVLVPKFMGDMTGMNPAIILLSLSIWGSLLGITGVIIALPVTTLLISYYRRFVINRENSS
jgi:predicted PurR-regulated permease PerM